MDIFLEALTEAFTFGVLIWVFAGFAIGVLAGALPGVGPELGILLVLPFTLGMDPAVALVFLVAIYTGGEYGGSIPAILINTPGTASAAAVVIDGYQMAKQGKAVTALAISGVASTFGNVLGGLVVLAALPFLGKVLLWFGTPEYFMMALLGLCTIALASRGSQLRGMIVALLGALLATVGSSAVVVDRRFTMGVIELNEGFALVPAFVGLFAVAEMVKLAVAGRIVDPDLAELNVSGRKEGLLWTLRRWPQVVKSSMLGLWVGIMPGQGGTVANYLSYMEAKASSREPERFGHGAPDGVLAPEAANNAIVPGSLVPTLTFGIPGSASSAVLLGGLLLHGLRPGTTMFDQRIDVTYAIFLSVITSAVFVFLVGWGLANYLGKVPNVPVAILVPLVIAVSLVGAYAVEANYFHVWQALLFGAVGLLLARYGYPAVPFVLGFILGPIAELNLNRSMLLSDGSLTIFIQRPFSAFLLALCLLVLLWPTWRAWRTRRKADPSRNPEPAFDRKARRER